MENKGNLLKILFFLSFALYFRAEKQFSFIPPLNLKE